MIDPPQVTIVIPCFNHGRFLRACLASVRAQTIPAWRAIVLDDASTDGETPALCDAEADDRVEIVHAPQNLGRSLIRNLGIARATTEAVLNLDADDLLTPDYLEKTLPLLFSAPDVGVVYTDYRTFGATEGTWKAKPWDEALLYRTQYIGGASLFRRSAWAKTTGYHGDFTIGNEDYDFWLRIVEAGYRGAYLPESLYEYRMHAASWSSGTDGGDDRLLRSRLLILEHHAAAFARHGAADAFLRETWWNEACRLTRVGRRWAARAMWWRVIRMNPWQWQPWLWLVWP